MLGRSSLWKTSSKVESLTHVLESPDWRMNRKPKIQCRARMEAWTCSPFYCINSLLFTFCVPPRLLPVTELFGISLFPYGSRPHIRWNISDQNPTISLPTSRVPHIIKPQPNINIRNSKTSSITILKSRKLNIRTVLGRSRELRSLRLEDIGIEQELMRAHFLRTSEIFLITAIACKNQHIVAKMSKRPTYQ